MTATVYLRNGQDRAFKGEDLILTVAESKVFVHETGRPKPIAFFLLDQIYGLVLSKEEKDA